MESAQDILSLGPDFFTHFEFRAQRFHFYPAILLSGTKGYRFFLPKHTITWFASVLKNQGVPHSILKLQSTRDFQTITKQYRAHQRALPIQSNSLQFQGPITERGFALSLQFLTHPETISAEDLAFLRYHQLVHYNPLIFYFHKPSPAYIRKTFIMSAVSTEVLRAKPLFDHIPYYRITRCQSPPRTTIPTVFDLIIPAELDAEVSQQITDHFSEKIQYFGEYLAPDYSCLPYLHMYPRHPRPDISQIHTHLLAWISAHLI